MTPETISRHLVDADPNQPRLGMESEDLKQLARSMCELGQLQPIIVFCDGERFTLVDGHRRHIAAGMARIEDLQALVLESPPSGDTLLLTQLAANCMRVDLKPTEKAAAFQRLKDSRGWSNTELAKAMHVSKAMVTRVLSYQELPSEAKVKLDAGELPSSTAYAITRASDATQKKSLLDQALGGELKRDEAQRNVGRNGKRAHRKTFRLAGIDITVSAEESMDLSEFVKLWQRLGRECKKAIQEGLDAETFEQVLAAKRRSHAQTSRGVSRTRDVIN